MTLSESEQQAFRNFELSGWTNAADLYHQHWGTLSSQSAEPMLDAARTKAGSYVLDIATGAGYVAAAAARRGATAIGIDFSETQIELAQKTYPDLEFRQANAEAIPYPAETFDAVVMGFGMNHLPEAETAVREVYRVLKSGGRFAFTVWAKPVSGEGFGIVLAAIDKYGVDGGDLPPAPPYFRFADAGEVERVLQPAGFVNPNTVIVPQYWRHTSPDEVFNAFNEGAVRATAMLRAQPRDVRQTIRLAVRSDVEKLRKGDAYIIPVPAALSYAQKP